MSSGGGMHLERLGALILVAHAGDGIPRDFRISRVRHVVPPSWTTDALPTQPLRIIPLHID